MENRFKVTSYTVLVIYKVQNNNRKLRWDRLLSICRGPVRPQVEGGSTNQNIAHPVLPDPDSLLILSEKKKTRRVKDTWYTFMSDPYISPCFFFSSLFPRMPRHNYHLVAQRVQELCEKHKIPYQMKSLGRGMVDVVR